MQQPTNLNEMEVKRLACLLGVRPTRVWLFNWQKHITRIESWRDTDHAGSVSGCALMLGGNTVSTYCEGHAVIALSSSEAKCNVW